jgi:predicted nucleic acid-binding protein
MNLYAESSAVLAWLFREAPGPLLEEILAGAEMVLASDLTLVECHRALIKAEATGQLSQFEVGQRRVLLENVASRWTLLKLDGEVLERARRRFP